MRNLKIERVRVIMFDLAKVFHKICLDNHITWLVSVQTCRLVPKYKKCDFRSCN